jgi:guanosine-3',5'-bis(diphosphate) 3'-pyrophosphohydrolase
MLTGDIQTKYQNALKFAATKHTEAEQIVPGTNLPYIVHISNVAMEIMVSACNTTGFNLQLAIQVALLHDTLEDTKTTCVELNKHFGEEVRQGVQALTKDRLFASEQRMEDCLRRIKLQPKEIWAVKLADRITNLQPPPSSWSKKKRSEYLEEAMFIWSELKEGNEYLGRRLHQKIDEYSNYL